MLRRDCQQCGSIQPLGSMRVVGDKLMCETCTGKALAENKNLQIAKIADATVCFKCGRDNGSAELPVLGGLPYCSTCREEFYSRPYPQWLRLAMGGLLVLLAGALVSGRPYWKAGKDLVRGERLVAARQFAQAGDPLRRVLNVAPECEEAILLLAKADILNGNPEEAYKLLSAHHSGQFKEGDLTSEVSALMTRIRQASEKAQAARKLDEQKRWAEAAQALREAATLYPEYLPLVFAAESAEGTIAFEKKDYDGFLANAEASVKKHPDYYYAEGMLASALACKYAVTGDAAYRQRSEEALARARQLTPADPQAQAATKDYEEHTRYRLDSRKIIDTDEYDRQFRQGAKEK
jgi:tetratricopeptide repeat protein